MRTGELGRVPRRRRSLSSDLPRAGWCRSYDENSERGVGSGSCRATHCSRAGRYNARTYRELIGARGKVTLGAMLVRNPFHAGGARAQGTRSRAGWLLRRALRAPRTTISGSGSSRRATGSSCPSLCPSTGCCRRSRRIYPAWPAPTAHVHACPRAGCLTRGGATSRRRQLRLQRALEQVGLALADRRSGRRSRQRIARHLPLSSFASPSRTPTAWPRPPGRSSDGDLHSPGSASTLGQLDR